MKITYRLINSVALMLAAFSFIALLTAAAQLQINLEIALFASVLASMFGIAAFKLNQRAKALVAPPPVVQIPEDFRVPFKVYQSKGWFLSIIFGLLVFALSAYLMLEDQPIFATICGVLAVHFTYLLINSIWSAAKPMLVFDDRGITSRKYGLIPWSIVDRTLFTQYSIRGRTVSCLNLFVNNLDTYLGKLNPLERALRLLNAPIERTAIQLSLDYLTHRPSYIDAVVKHLRAKYATSIGVSLITGDLSMDKRSADIERIFASIDPKGDQKSIRQAMKQVEQLSKEQIAEIKKDHELLKRQSNAIFAVSVAVLFLFLLYLTFKFI